ncbi:MAG: aquaporin family protein [Acidobacteriia bacterium]|nr:aquaporin family protein [Terriglobia bacterium]
MGTLVLVLIGNGVVANVVLKKTLGSAAGWLTIVFGFGLGVVAGVFTAIACGSGDAHINPAVTLAFAISSGDFSKFVPYLIAQVLGGFVGGTLVWIHFMPHWAETPDAGSKLACFSTGPAIKNTVANIISEIIGTFLLVLTIASIVKTSPAPGLVPFLVGAMVWAIGSGLGGTTGFAINPARDLGPRIAHAILPIPGKGGSDFGYGLTVPVLGGLIGGALAGLFIKVAHL